MDPAATAAASAGLLEPGAKEIAARHLGRTAHNMSSSSLRKKSDLALLRKVPCAPLRRLLDNLQEVLLGTKLVLLFPAVILALAARIFHFGQASCTWLPPSVPPPPVIAFGFWLQFRAPSFNFNHFRASVPQFRRLLRSMPSPSDHHPTGT